MRKSIGVISSMAIGVALGAALGDAVGQFIRSDNLPFFWALGGFVGGCAALTVALVVKWIRGDGTGSSGKASSGGLRTARK